MHTLSLRTLVSAAALVLAACSSEPTSTGSAIGPEALAPTSVAETIASTSTPPSTTGTVKTTSTVKPATSTVAPTTTTAAATPVPLGCAANELPPPGAPSVVMVAGITANDADLGLNVRFDAGTASAVQFSLPNGTVFFATGQCEKTADGLVWWEIEDGHWSGWAAANWLTSWTPSTSVCPQENYSAIGKGTVERILGDFDGDGLVDALHLSYDGVVQAPAVWTGSQARVQVQFADGGLSTEVDVAPLLGDGGPTIGVSQLPTFPQRIDPAGTNRSVAVLGSTYAGSATGAGLSHFVGVDGCDPVVVAEIPVTPSVGNRQEPFLCDLGGGGRVQLYAIDGLSANFDYLVTRYDFVGPGFTLQPQVTAGNAGNDPNPTIC